MTTFRFNRGRNVSPCFYIPGMGKGRDKRKRRRKIRRAADKARPVVVQVETRDSRMRWTNLRVRGGARLSFNFEGVAPVVSMTLGDEDAS